MALDKIEIENFTAFDHLELTFSSGLNVLIGENGTGKTHLMKLGYASFDAIHKLINLRSLAPLRSVHTPYSDIELKRLESLHNGIPNLMITDLFLPYNKDLTRLLNNKKTAFTINTRIEKCKHKAIMEKNKAIIDKLINASDLDFSSKSLKTIYIPPKDALANAPGFRSLYEKREIHFESIYKDILDSAFLPFLRERNLTKTQHNMLAMLEKNMGGKVSVRGETFFLDNGTDEPLEFDLLAEGMRKLGLLWLLIRNGELDKDTVLFWDEPETNLNPKLMGVIVQVLIELQRMGVQVILATHNFVLLQELDLRLEAEDKILFHSLYRDHETQEIKVASTAEYLQITHNPISEVYTELWDRDLQKSFEKEENKDAAE